MQDAMEVTFQVDKESVYEYAKWHEMPRSFTIECGVYTVLSHAKVWQIATEWVRDNLLNVLFTRQVTLVSYTQGIGVTAEFRDMLARNMISAIAFSGITAHVHLRSFADENAFLRYFLFSKMQCSMGEQALVVFGPFSQQWGLS